MEAKIKWRARGAAGGWARTAGEVIGPDLGAVSGISIIREDEIYKGWYAWNPSRSICYTESQDGVSWELPQVVLTASLPSQWEFSEVGAPCVIKKDGRYHMWYSGKTFGGENRVYHGSIGYAGSADGLTWTRMEQPVLTAQLDWERTSVSSPHVLWDQEKGIFRMWYSAGHMHAGDCIGYAESVDGFKWEKRDSPVFSPREDDYWEMFKTENPYILIKDGWHYLFYEGHDGDNTPSVGLARSRDGISGWQEHPDNPILAGTDGTWDHGGIRKPFVLEEDGFLRMWYIGCHQQNEQVGIAEYRREALFPENGQNYQPERGSKPEYRGYANFYLDRHDM